MSTSSITGSSAFSASDAASFGQMKKDFQSLTSDVQSGNLSGAQADFATLLQDAPQLQTAAASSSSPLASAFSSLSSALQSGDITGAQSALSTLQQSAAAAPHHGHHHHGQSQAPATDPTTDASGFQVPSALPGVTSPSSVI